MNKQHKCINNSFRLLLALHTIYEVIHLFSAIKTQGINDWLSNKVQRKPIPVNLMKTLGILEFDLVWIIAWALTLYTEISDLLYLVTRKCLGIM